MLVVIQAVPEASQELFFAPCLIQVKTMAMLSLEKAAMGGGGILSSPVRNKLVYKLLDEGFLVFTSLMIWL